MQPLIFDTIVLVEAGASHGAALRAWTFRMFKGGRGFGLALVLVWPLAGLWLGIGFVLVGQWLAFDLTFGVVWLCICFALVLFLALVPFLCVLTCPCEHVDGDASHEQQVGTTACYESHYINTFMKAPSCGKVALGGITRRL